jgi:hypothetical protein
MKGEVWYKLAQRKERKFRATGKCRKHSPQKKRNGDTPLGYSGRTGVRREQCDEMPESRNSGIRSEVDF